MERQITSELQFLGQEKGFKILYAVESGSRAWGFASQNSDWDVRFIYLHPKNWYLRIDEGKDNYSKILQNDIDLSGWELRKALKLLRKSNPSLLEWLSSSIFYVENDAFLIEMKMLADYYFNPKSCMYHYLSMAKNTVRIYLEGKEQVFLKKYFYALRPILAAEYIQKYQKIPPIEFDVLLEASRVSDEVLAEMEILLEKKRNAIEKDLMPTNKILTSYIDLKINELEVFLSNFSYKQPKDSSNLNDFFIRQIEEF
jgi:uncharacterized protein